MNNYPVSCQRSATPEYFPRFIGGASVLFTAGVVLKKNAGARSITASCLRTIYENWFLQKENERAVTPFLSIISKNNLEINILQMYLNNVYEQK
ncbi:MAG: hypothetical protein RR303_08755 [Bacteroidales bacterium]